MSSMNGSVVYNGTAFEEDFGAHSGGHASLDYTGTGTVAVPRIVENRMHEMRDSFRQLKRIVYDTKFYPVIEEGRPGFSPTLARLRKLENSWTETERPLASLEPIIMNRGPLEEPVPVNDIGRIADSMNTRYSIADHPRNVSKWLHRVKKVYLAGKNGTWASGESLDVPLFVNQVAAIDEILMKVRSKLLAENPFTNYTSFGSGCHGRRRK